MKRTKIVCTLGPSSSDEFTIAQMVENGMNVARFNFSHGTHEYHKSLMDTVKKVRDKMKCPLAIMLDTKGPEIRIGTFKEKSIVLNAGDTFTLTSNDIQGDNTKVSITYKDLPSQLSVGSKILIDDGRVLLQAAEITDTDIICSVLEGGTLSDRKGVNIPYIHIDLPYLSEKDQSDIKFGIEQNVDFISASFTRTKEDVIQLRNFLDYYGGHDIKIISKIENIEGINNFDEILEHSDGIMVARGDMGVEVEFERLPGLQKKFIRKCYQQGKMVITATQMLDSMIHNNTPTRAEITDVANAIFDGTSAIMLSGETAMGKHPVLAVKVMSKIAVQAETDAFNMEAFRGFKYDIDSADTTNAICDAACTTAKDVNASAIIAVTKLGYTARRVSKFRPNIPIIAATYVEKTFHQLALSWGVFPVLALPQQSTDNLFTHAIDCAKTHGLVKNGDLVVITAGVPLDVSGTTNLLKVQAVEEKR